MNVRVPAATTTIVTDAGNAKGFLKVASTTGFYPGARIAVNGTVSTLVANEVRIIAVPDSTHLQVVLVDLARPGASGQWPVTLPAYTTGDVVTQDDQTCEIPAPSIPASLTVPSRAT